MITQWYNMPLTLPPNKISNFTGSTVRERDGVHNMTATNGFDGDVEKLFSSILIKKVFWLDKVRSWFWICVLSEQERQNDNNN